MANATARLKITDIALDRHIPYAKSARTHSDAQIAEIAASIREFGWTNPVLVDGDSGIIAGHGRVLAARKLGMDKAPCIELKHLTEAQRRAYVIADNKLALNAGWDEALLGLELADLDADGFDPSLLGFGEDEIGALLGALGATDGLTDPDEAPEAPEQPVSVTGDLWRLGRHRLLCGDATSADEVPAVRIPMIAAGDSDGSRSQSPISRQRGHFSFGSFFWLDGRRRRVRC